LRAIEHGELRLHIATCLIEEGARVWIVACDQRQGVAAAERIGCEFEPRDFADGSSVIAAFEKVNAAAGRLDVM